MNAKKMFISLIPWALFSLVINRHGSSEAGRAAVIAAGLALILLVKDSRTSTVKVLDVTGVLTFGVLAAACFAGGTSTADWVADYGRGLSALVLALVMLASALVLPFTEQYARESVPREYWHSPVFRAVNRRISAVWGAIVLVMGLGHLLAGLLDPATDPAGGSRPADLLLNWLVPALLILAAVNYTRRATAAVDRPNPAPPAGPSAQPAQNGAR